MAPRTQLRGSDLASVEGERDLCPVRTAAETLERGGEDRNGFLGLQLFGCSISEYLETDQFWPELTISSFAFVEVWCFQEYAVIAVDRLTRVLAGKRKLRSDAERGFVRCGVTQLTLVAAEAFGNAALY
ncbi:MAG: hypothetical protein RL701_1444 [Pseudomonadota bacterium]